MKKSTFEEISHERWDELEILLKQLEKNQAGSEAARLPGLFRQSCHDLSLAQHRMYGRKLCDRLNQLVVRCYHQLHRRAGRSGQRVIQLVSQTFPQAIREEWRLFALAFVLFFGPFCAMIAAAYYAPHWIFSLLGPAELTMLDQMHGAGAQPTAPFEKEYGEMGVHFMMFAYYVQHNIGIGLTMFGMGMLFTVGSVYALITQGLILGAMFGYIHYTGHADNIWRFAIGHSSFELLGLIVCGVAGMRLGLGVLFPGRNPRGRAIILAGRRALPILLGGAGMLFLAAMVEGFWSSRRELGDDVRYAFGVIMWVVWALYFLLVGRGMERSRIDDP